MTKLPAEAGAFDLVCAPDGLYYRIQLNRVRTKPYAYFKCDLFLHDEVTEQAFNRAKYRGEAGPYEDGEEMVHLPDATTRRCFYHSSVVRLFDADGTLLRALPDTMEAFCGMYSLALDADGHLWAADPCYHHVAQYEVATGRQLFSRGGSWDPGEFDHSEDIGIYGEHAFISDMGNQRLVRLNTRTRRYDTYRAFAQPQPHQRLGLLRGTACRKPRPHCHTGLFRGRRVPEQCPGRCHGNGLASRAAFLLLAQYLLACVRIAPDRTKT